jgi:8-oxo-dGTP pyrophosphatase MutT (NUDIX family)
MEPGWFQVTLKLFLWHEGRYLALRDSQTGFGDLPGGRIGLEEAGNLPAALQREVREELGEAIKIEFHPEPITLFSHYVLKDSAPAFAFVFEGIWKSGEWQLSGEHTELFWLKPDDDPSSIFVGTMLEGVQKYLATDPLSRINGNRMKR